MGQTSWDRLTNDTRICGCAFDCDEIATFANGLTPEVQRLGAGFVESSTGTHSGLAGWGRHECWSPNNRR